ncbi:MAG: hypothetical protein ACSHW1_21030, partial [Yoonia sp.]|uniref:hypothetical protein n=1 Tax=Yoonia sp. TaxID=2212373 RepID=UPI003EF5CF5C
MKRFLHFISSYVFAIACGVATLAAAEAIGVAAYNISQRGVGILDIADVDLLNLLPPIHELFLVGLAVFLVPTALIWAGLSAIGKASRAL